MSFYAKNLIKINKIAYYFRYAHLIGIESYGISSSTIEEVFLRLFNSVIH